MATPSYARAFLRMRGHVKFRKMMAVSGTMKTDLFVLKRFIDSPVGEIFQLLMD